MILKRAKRNAVLVLEVDPQLQSLDVIGIADRLEKNTTDADPFYIEYAQRLMFGEAYWLKDFCWIRPQKVITREVHDFLIPTAALDDCVNDCPRCKNGLTCQANQIVFAHVRHGVIGSAHERDLAVHMTRESPIVVVYRRDRRGLVTLDMREDERLAVGLRRLLTGEIIHFTRVLKPEGNENGSDSRD